MTVQPGWYADPAEPSTQRWWDGEGWVGAPLPADATPPPGPPEPEPEPQPQSPAGPQSTGAGGPPGTPVAPSDSPAGVPTGTGSVPAQGGPPHWVPVPGTWPPPGGQPPPNWPHQPLPYAPLPEPRPHGFALAPLGARLAARLIDIGIVFLLNVVVNGWFVWRYVQEILPAYREMLRRYPSTSSEGLPESEQAGSLQIAILLIAVALWFAYEVPATRNSGQTLGKRLMGIRVVSVGADEGLSFGRSMRRWNTLGLPVFLWVCCLGFLLQLVDCVFPLFDRPLRQALHDKRAHTVVVQVPRHPVDSPATRPDDRTEPPGGNP